MMSVNIILCEKEKRIERNVLFWTQNRWKGCHTNIFGALSVASLLEAKRPCRCGGACAFAENAGRLTFRREVYIYINLLFCDYMRLTIMITLYDVMRYAVLGVIERPKLFL